MAKAFSLDKRMANISEQAGRRLDRMDKLLPDVKQPALPFEQYMAQAQAVAQQDPAFAEQLQRALRAQRAITGGM